MNNKMAINTHQSTTDSKKQTNMQNINRIMDTLNILMDASWEGASGDG